MSLGLSLLAYNPRSERKTMRFETLSHQFFINFSALYRMLNHSIEPFVAQTSRLNNKYDDDAYSECGAI